MSRWILDASALLALIHHENGWERVYLALLDGAAISCVNLSEVVARLADRGMRSAEIQRDIYRFSFHVFAFDEGLALQAGFLRPLTRSAGLSFGDRACLALAQHLGLPVLTADRAWLGLNLDIDVQVIR